MYKFKRKTGMGRGRGDRFKALGMSNFYTLEGCGRKEGFISEVETENQDATGLKCLSREKLK